MIRLQSAAKLRRCTDNRVYGWKTCGKIQQQTKDSLIAVANNKSRHFRKLTNAHYLRHFAGDDTLYFYGNGGGKTKDSTCLVMIDIDAHTRGSLHDSMLVACHLRDYLGIPIYYETSTNGNGVHGYIILDNSRIGVEATRKLFRVLDKAVRKFQCPGIEKIDGIEIKGMPCLFLYDKEGQLVDIHMGTLAKLPRDIEWFDSFRDRDHFGWDDLEPISCGELESLVDKLNLFSPRESGEAAGTGVPKSIQGHPVNTSDMGLYRIVAEKIMPLTLACKGTRATVLREDLAITIAILDQIKPNADGSTPVNRIKSIWVKLKENGEINRSWNSHRFTSIRNYLSASGFLDWQEMKYTPKNLSADGKGYACRWSFNTRMLDLLSRSRGGPRVRDEEPKTETLQDWTSLGDNSQFPSNPSNPDATSSDNRNTINNTTSTNTHNLVSNTNPPVVLEFRPSRPHHGVPVLWITDPASIYRRKIA